MTAVESFAAGHHASALNPNCAVFGLSELVTTTSSGEINQFIVNVSGASYAAPATQNGIFLTLRDAADAGGAGLRYDNVTKELYYSTT